MRKGLKRTSILLEPAQYAALRDEATRRAARSGGHADASAIIRELVAAWMEREAKRTKSGRTT